MKWRSFLEFFDIPTSLITFLGVLLFMSLLGCEPTRPRRHQQQPQTGPPVPVAPVVPPKPPEPPKPCITVEALESSRDGVSLKIFYDFHDNENRTVTDQDGNKVAKFTATVTIKTVEDLAYYRKQVEFLQNRLDEVEKRMQVHEQSSEPKPIPTASPDAS